MRFQGNTIVFTDKPSIETKEGPKAWKDAINYLNTMKPVANMTWSDGLALAARDHCMDHGPKGLVGHFGTENSSPWSRIGRYGMAFANQGENVIYEANTALDIVFKQFVNDGDKTRGDRENILNPNYGVMGVKHCKHES